ncbi:hypothetical protein D3C81_965250 [compost metagenome]
MQALGGFFQHAGTGLQRNRAAIDTQVRRTNQTTHVGDAQCQVRALVGTPRYGCVIDRSELGLQLGLPAVDRHLEQADAAFVRAHLALHVQARRHLQVVAMFGAQFRLALGAAFHFHFDFARLLPRQHAHRADQRLLTCPTLRHPLDGLVAITLALIDGAADQQQGNQQQQRQPADNGEAQKQFQGSHVPSSCGNRGTASPRPVSRVCGEFEVNVKSGLRQHQTGLGAAVRVIAQLRATAMQARHFRHERQAQTAAALPAARP